MNASRSTLLFILTAILLLGLALFAANHFSTSSNQSNSGQLQIATTIFPLTDIAQQIGGDNIAITQLLPSGASPHSYTLTPQQVADLGSAQTLFIIGHSLDDWASKPATAAGIPITTVDTDITLLPFIGGHDHDHDTDTEHEDEDEEESSDGLDPHYWLTVPNGQQIARNIAARLQELDPVHADIYAANLSSYLQQLDTLENELQDITSSATQPHFMTIHNAWSYLANQYHFELVDTYEPEEGQSPTLADLQHLQASINQYGLKTFYTEPQKQSSAGIRLIEQELGLSIKTLDPLGGIEDRSSFADLMRYNITQLAN